MPYQTNYDLSETWYIEIFLPKFAPMCNIGILLLVSPLLMLKIFIICLYQNKCET